MPILATARRMASPLALVLFADPLFAASARLPAEADSPADPLSTTPDVVVIGQRQADTIEQAPLTRASVTGETIRTTINAFNVEDTLKYLPSLVVRKRHIGDTQAPLATRTSGLGASARSLIFADGALLSALIGNNNTFASPRWNLVSPAEIARVDVLYGPFSAAYAGNAIGAVVNITTRQPDRFEATLDAGTNIQQFAQYGTRQTLPSYQLAATIGDRFGPLALFAAITHTDSRAQPLSYVTATSAPGGTTGAFPDRNRLGAPINVLGASGIEAQSQQTIKFKATLDVSSQIRLSYVLGLFLNDTAASAQSYLTNVAGAPAYTSGFSAGIYRYAERHWSHALSLSGVDGPIDWRVIGTIYDFANDKQRTPTALLPAAFTGGAGNLTRLDGTGWSTIDARLAWRADQAGALVISSGFHWDRYSLNSNRYALADWLAGAPGALNQASRGRTQTAAVWTQAAVRLAPPLTLTLGGRYEWWRADQGLNFSLAPLLNQSQPARAAQGFSPKASLEYRPGAEWVVRASFGRALRFPTVGELYQAITTGVTLTVPNPDLRPEDALSEEFAIEHRAAFGTARLSLFNEVIRDALISQSAPLVAGSATLFNYVQNVQRTRARGIEAAIDWADFPLRRVDLSAGATYADATTRRDDAFPAAVGKRLPSVPEWKANVVLSWRPSPNVSLTAGARYASRNYATLDNSDIVGNTYQGFYQYLVVDLRARFTFAKHYTLAVGIDNVNDDRYFLFHPFPQRAFTAEIGYRF